MKWDIFDQETEIGRSRFSIIQLLVFTLGLTGSSVSTLLSVLGILPLTPMIIGIPITAVTGVLALFCFIPLIFKIAKHTKIDKEDVPVFAKLTDEERRSRRQKRYSLPDGNSIAASNDNVSMISENIDVEESYRS